VAAHLSCTAARNKLALTATSPTAIWAMGQPSDFFILPKAGFSDFVNVVWASTEVVSHGFSQT